MDSSEPDGVNHLSHYGVKGMKWGVKRSRAQLRKAKPDQEQRTARKSTAKARRMISDGDLEKAIDRLSKEKKLKTLTDEDLSPGKAAAKRIMSESGQKVARTVITGAALYAVKVAVDKKMKPGAAGYIAPKPKK
jgi:hypothetical protein